ncbi:MAG: MerR family DNA-binding transcriptional regulator [Planctomycetota bacterium]|nr:MAG: MerR family DNA-binding transcriptional regulator [Planctomycetota bacterium]
MKQLLTPSQVARAIGVSIASLKRWCDKGLISSERTAGGHRRIPIQGVMRFLRETGRPLVRPDLLGLPPATCTGDRVTTRCRRHLVEAMVAGDDEKIHRLIIETYVSGFSADEICDDILTPALATLGELWQAGNLEIYQERRACEICHCALRRMNYILDPPPDHAPLAIGGTPEGDPYGLPTLMAAFVLRSLGWRTEPLGSNLPLSTIAAAIDDMRPNLLWLSVSSVPDIEHFVREYKSLYESAGRFGVAIAVGGRALTETVREQMHYSTYCDNFAHLRSFVETLRNGATRASNRSAPSIERA